MSDFGLSEQQRILGPLLENKVELIFYNERPFEEILKEVASLPPHSAIFFQQYGGGRRRCRLWRQGAIEAHLMRSPTPPFFRSTRLTLTVRLLAARCFHRPRVADGLAAAAVRLLGGEKASGIKVPPIDFSAPKYDWRQLQRWNISESRLPPGSEILFREPTAWQRYSWQIALDHRRCSLAGRADRGPAT